MVRVRLARYRPARVAVTDARLCTRHRTAVDAGAARRRGSERLETWPRPRAHPTCGGTAHRSPEGNASRRRTSRTAARTGGRATGAGDTADAQPRRTLMDRRPACQVGGAVAFGFFR